MEATDFANLDQLRWAADILGKRIALKRSRYLSQALLNMADANYLRGLRKEIEERERAYAVAQAHPGSGQ